MPNSFSIDDTNLDVEWKRQQRLVIKFGTEWADAKLELADCERQLDVVRASIRKDIRIKPKKYGLLRPTKDAVDDEILLQPKYDKALQTYNKAKHLVDLLAVKMKALEHKKKALGDIVSLTICGWKGEPVVPRHSRERAEEAEKHRVRRKGAMRRDTEEEEDDE